MAENFDEEFYFAASLGDADTIRSIFEAGDFTGINTRNPQRGNTPLIIACAYGFDVGEDVSVFCYSDVIKLLVLNGADINLVNNRGQSALYMAASWGHWDIVAYLLENGAYLDDAEGLLGVVSWTKPRRRYHNYAPGVYYNNHRLAAKHHGYDMAKIYMERVRDSGEFAEILTNLDEDYDTLLAYSEEAENLQLDVPDDIMAIVVFYNHFATVAELIRHMEPEPEPEFELLSRYAARLNNQRQQFEDTHED